MRVFTAEIWAIIKALEKIKNYVASKCKNIYGHTFVSLGITLYEAGTSLDWDGDTKVCHFILCQSALGLPRSKIGVPYNDFKQN